MKQPCVYLLASKGQVVVPKRVREALQANSGARIAFELKGDKAVMFVVVREDREARRRLRQGHEVGVGGKKFARRAKRLALKPPVTVPAA